MLENLLAVGLAAVKMAEAITLQYFGQIEQHMVSSKEEVDVTSKHYKSPATIADQEAEKIIVGHIKKHFPDHNILGEEGGSEDNKSDYTWIIDPIDGTKQYMRGMDDWAILLALQHQGEIIMGISCMPVVGELVWAAKGMGCFCDDVPCRVSDRQLSDAFVSHERYKYFQARGLVDGLEQVRGQVAHYIANKTPRMFHYLVQGKIDAIIGYDAMYLYDIAPYPIMITEAGGQCTTFEGGVVKDERTSFIASNGVVHEGIRGCFAPK